MGTIEGAISRGQAVRSRGLDLYVDTANGSNNNDGLSWEQAKATMAAALALATDHSSIYVVGDVREQISAPLGIQGVRVIGAAGGRPRHDDGVRWRAAAVAGNAPLLIVHEQGWEFQNILFVPQSTYSALKFWRAEDANHPDGSHAIVRGCKFIGPGGIGTPQGIGIEDFGGMHHMLFEDNEFCDLDFAIKATDVSIANPLRNTIRRNVFDGNKNDIAGNYNRGIVRENIFNTVYHATNHPITVNLAYTADGAVGNQVLDNVFADAAANVTIAKGYKPSTGDIWRNRVTDTAADIVAVPA